MAQDPAPAPAKKKRGLILAAAAVLLAGGGAVVFLKGGAPPAEEHAEDEGEHGKAEGGEKASGGHEQPEGHEKPKGGHEKPRGGHGKPNGGGHGGGGASAESESPGLLRPEPFILNLADPEGDRFLRLSLYAVFDEEHALPSAADHVRLRDRLLSILSSKTAEEITTYAGKEALRAELRQALERMIAESAVLDLYFTEFLVQ